MANPNSLETYIALAHEMRVRHERRATSFFFFLWFIRLGNVAAGAATAVLVGTSTAGIYAAAATTFLAGLNTTTSYFDGAYSLHSNIREIFLEAEIRLRSLTQEADSMATAQTILSDAINRSADLRNEINRKTPKRPARETDTRLTKSGRQAEQASGGSHD